MCQQRNKDLLHQFFLFSYQYRLIPCRNVFLPCSFGCANWSVFHDFPQKIVAPSVTRALHLHVEVVFNVGCLLIVRFCVQSSSFFYPPSTFILTFFKTHFTEDSWQPFFNTTFLSVITLSCISATGRGTVLLERQGLSGQIEISSTYKI